MPTPIEQARSILESGRMISGLANCHVPGLYSVVLRERVNDEVGMLRIFYASETCKLNHLMSSTINDYTVMPHNHRQDISLFGLFGEVRNQDRVYVPGDGMYFEYRFGSALVSGEFSLKLASTARLETSKSRPIGRDGVHLKASDVHTVIAEPGSAWLVSEGKLSKNPFTLCYSLLFDKKLSSEGLYQPIPAEALSSWAAHLLGEWESA